MDKEVYFVLLVLAVGSFVFGFIVYGEDFGPILSQFNKAIFCFGLAIAFLITAARMGQFAWIGLLIALIALGVGVYFVQDAFSIADSVIG